jgi:phospholipid/cholesterol/gamma-HCH transport system permease protein
MSDRISPARPGATAALAAAHALRGWLTELGEQVRFHTAAVAATPSAVRRYRREIWRLLAEVSLGRGAVALVAGTVGIIIFETVSVGAVVGLVGFQGLRQIGITAYIGFLSAYFNTREVAPLIAANALIATVGAGFTAQLGAMRISEEIDALEVMAIPSVAFLVTTRLIAALGAIVPLYAIALLGSYLATQAVSVSYYGITSGTYDHYFALFLPPVDVVYSFIKAVVFTAMISLICCYYGYRATGGPAGVGTAVGRAVRFCTVACVTADFFLSLALWGSSTTVRIAG